VDFVWQKIGDLRESLGLQLHWKD